MNTEKGFSMTSLVMIVVVGLVIGLGSMIAFKNSDMPNNATTAQAETSNMMPSTNTKAADLRVMLNSLDKEHIALTGAAVRNGFDGDPDFEASAKALDNNSVAISQAVGKVYGSDAEQQFLKMWRDHITFFVNYTTAAKQGDHAGMDKAVADLNGYVDDVSTFLSKANPNLPKAAVTQLFTDHVSHLKSMVDAYAAEDYAGSYTQQHAAYEQVGKIADGLAGAIVKQKPEMFK